MRIVLRPALRRQAFIQHGNYVNLFCPLWLRSGGGRLAAGRTQYGPVDAQVPGERVVELVRAPRWNRSLVTVARSTFPLALCGKVSMKRSVRGTK
jgi:hypothetical protein